MTDNSVTGILLDTSFLIRHSNKEYSLHKNAKDYFKYFIKKKLQLRCPQLPLRNIV